MKKTKAISRIALIAILLTCLQMFGNNSNITKTYYTFVEPNDAHKFMGNEALRKFYLKNYVQVMDSKFARERYYGDRQVLGRTLGNTDGKRTVILFIEKLKADIRSGKVSFGTPIRNRNIGFMPFIDTYYIPGIQAYNKPECTIMVVNFEKYRALSIGWKYHDAFAYGIDQTSEGHRELTSPILHINSPELIALRKIISKIFSNTAYYLMATAKLYPSKSLSILTDRQYKRYKQYITKAKVIDGTDIVIRTMDLHWTYMPARFIAAIPDYMFRISNTVPYNGDEDTIQKELFNKKIWRINDPSKVSHIPSINRIKETDNTSIYHRYFPIPPEDISTVSLNKSGWSHLWNRWDTNNWDYMNRSRKVLYVPAYISVTPEIATWWAYIIDVKLHYVSSFLPTLLEVLMEQSALNAVRYIGERTGADYVIPVTMDRLNDFKRQYPNAEFIPFGRELYRLIRVSASKPFMYHAALEASGSLVVGRVYMGLGKYKGKYVSRSQQVMGQLFGVVTELKRYPNTMNQPNNGAYNPIIEAGMTKFYNTVEDQSRNNNTQQVQINQQPTQEPTNEADLNEMSRVFSADR